MEPGPELAITDEGLGITALDRRAFRRAQRRRERANGGYCVFEGTYFRGKLYADLIRFVTRVWLYRSWIPPQTVAAMARSFERRDPEAIIRGYRRSVHRIYDHSPTEVADLREFLRVCARRGLGLVGSW